MTIGRIGNAVCRLMDAAGTLRVTVEALEKDPAAVLCDNPCCADCVRQRGFIRREQLAAEGFTLAVRIDEPVHLFVLGPKLWEYGITAIEIGSAWLRQLLKDGVEASAKAITDSDLTVTAVDVSEAGSLSDALALARQVRCPAIVTAAPDGEPGEGRAWLERVAGEAAASDLELLVRNRRDSLIGTAESTELLSELPAGLAFDPAEFAAAGQNPFLTVYYHGLSKSLVRQLYVKDGTFDGRVTEPGQGNGEVKELISILRCRGFRGPMVIWPGETIAAPCETFWTLLRTM